MNKLIEQLCYFALVIIFCVYAGVIEGDDKVLNILSFENSEKHGQNILKKEPKPNSEDLDLLKKYINENNVEEALKIIDSLGREHRTAGDAEKENGEKNNDMDNEKQTADEEKDGEKDEAERVQEHFNMQSFGEMMKFYSYIQEVLNSKAETSEKKLVRQFLRKSIQNLKKNEKEDSKRTVEDIIKHTEGHKEMLEKLANIMKIDKEKLEDEEVRNNLDKVLIGILKFIDYTNKSDVIDNLLDEIEVTEVENNEEETTDGGRNGASGIGTRRKLQLDLNNSKAHLEMLQKASNFMGIEIKEEKLKELTSNNAWYQQYINKLLDYASSSDEL